MIQINSLTTRQLSKSDILNICKLKNQHWKYGLNSNLKWFKKNIKKKDIHNLFFFGNKLLGYTLLRKRYAFIRNQKIEKKINYLYFDTLIIKKKFRKRNYSKILMNFNSYIITKQKLHSFLVCTKRLINFYKKYNWIILDKEKFQVKDRKFSKTGMIFNKRFKLKNNKILYYI